MNLLRAIVSTHFIRHCARGGRCTDHPRACVECPIRGAAHSSRDARCGRPGPASMRRCTQTATQLAALLASANFKPACVNHWQLMNATTRQHIARPASVFVTPSDVRSGAVQGFNANALLHFVIGYYRHAMKQSPRREVENIMSD